MRGWFSRRYSTSVVAPNRRNALVSACTFPRAVSLQLLMLCIGIVNLVAVTRVTCVIDTRRRVIEVQDPDRLPESTMDQLLDSRCAVDQHCCLVFSHEAGTLALSNQKEVEKLVGIGRRVRLVRSVVVRRDLVIIRTPKRDDRDSVRLEDPVSARLPVPPPVTSERIGIPVRSIASESFAA